MKNKGGNLQLEFSQLTSDLFVDYLRCKVTNSTTQGVQLRRGSVESQTHFLLKCGSKAKIDQLGTLNVVSLAQEYIFRF